MKEEFIHFLWKYRLFNTTEIRTTDGLPLRIHNPGIHNYDSGPDFFAAQINIGNTLWAGNVEMHLMSSDWEKHGHHTDNAYSNIILHVVMKHDREINDKEGNTIPVLEISQYFDPGLLTRYEKLMASRSWIPCEKIVSNVDPMIKMNWLSRLVAERLENKSSEILHFLNFFENSWEQTFYYFLARNFGFKVNSTPFALLAQKTPYKILAKHKNDLTQIEALLFGQAGFLTGDFKDAYHLILKKEYDFLKYKYGLQGIDKSLWKFGKLRPSNFPTLRIAQFAGLVHESSGLFSQIIECRHVEEILKLFAFTSSPYWNNHYVFDKASIVKNKNLGRAAIENIIINTIVPLKFVYGMQNLKPDIQDQAISLLNELPSENNTIITHWKSAGVIPQNAGDGQALLELKKYYCTPRRCLSCAIGHNLIKTV